MIEFRPAIKVFLLFAKIPAGVKAYRHKNRININLI